ncbi:MAG: haloalkane dehalogenase [Actinomycetota bacterium]|nr:haloalkane dehalogenase [Actinomycetota bacterium]
MTTPAYRTPDERFDDLPGYEFAPHYLEQDGLRMHYLDEGSGPAVLLLHGEPTWSYLYRKIIPELTPSARAIAPDYFGFGRSDKPLRMEDYSYDFHVDSIERLADELDLRDATVVVQDWGGPIGLRLAVERPDRIGKIVIMNTGIGGGRPPSEEWLRFRDWVRRLGTEMIPGRLVELSAIQPIAEEVVEAYSAPWPVPESKAGIVAFPELVPTSPDHPDTPAHLAVRAQLARWEKPTLVLFSDSDPIFSPRHAERIAEHIPGALAAEIVAGAGHFLQEDQGELIGRRIAEFVASTS